MSRLTLRLPETLHQQLAQVAEREGVSLNQYIVYALTRQTSAISQLQGVNIDLGSPQFEREVERQQSLFVGLKERLGEASSTDVAAILAEREVVSCEPELTIETIDRLRKKIAAAKQ